MRMLLWFKNRSRIGHACVMVGAPTFSLMYVCTPSLYHDKGAPRFYPEKFAPGLYEDASMVQE